jgi:hypothetical protein
MDESPRPARARGFPSSRREGDIGLPLGAALATIGVPIVGRPGHRRFRSCARILSEPNNDESRVSTPRAALSTLIVSGPRRRVLCTWDQLAGSEVRFPWFCGSSIPHGFVRADGTSAVPAWLGRLQSRRVISLEPANPIVKSSEIGKDLTRFGSSLPMRRSIILRAASSPPPHKDGNLGRSARPTTVGDPASDHVPASL